jgi:hypothetical protein
MADAQPEISFDDNNNVRVLSTSHMKHTEELEMESKAFTSQITQFEKSISSLVESLSEQGDRIEKEKLKVSGGRYVFSVS